MREDRSGYVYVVQMEGHAYYKIGRTVHLNRRMTQISPQMPGKLRVVFALKVRDAWRTESNLHSDLSSKRMNGEWFCLGADDLEQIRLHLLIDQSFLVTQKLLGRINRDAYDSAVSLLLVARLGELISKSAKRTERRIQKFFNLARERDRRSISDPILEAEIVL